MIMLLDKDNEIKYAIIENVSSHNVIRVNFQERIFIKYELTNIKEDYKGTTIYRIRALEDIRDDFEERRNLLKIKKGDLGGWVSGYHNLSQQGKCWIYDNSIVTDNAKVEDDAIVLFNSIMEGNSTAYNRSVICNSYLNLMQRVKNSPNLQVREMNWHKHQFVI